MAERHFRNASWSGMAAAIRAGTGLLASLLAIRLLGVVQYGHVAMWLSLFVLYLSLNSSVLTMLVVKLVGSGSGEQVRDQGMAIAAAVTFCAGSMALLAVTTVLLDVYVIQLPLFGGTLPMGFGYAILLMGLLTAIQIAAALQAAVIEGAGRLDLATKWQLAGPLAVVTALAFSFLSHNALDAVKYVALLCGGALVDMCLLWAVRSSLSLPLLIPAQPSGRLRGVLQLLRAGGVLQAASLLTLFLEPANKFLLNHFVGAAAVGIYDLAMKVVWGIQHLFGSAMRIFLHIGSQDRDAVGKVFAKVIILLGVPVVVLHVMGALFLFWTARHWMAIDASSLMIFFGIAAISNLGMIFVTPLYLSLIGRNDLSFIFRTQAVLAVVNVSVSGALIPFFGLVGSAFGLLAATALNAAAIYVRCRIDAATFAAESYAISRAKRRIAMAVGLLAATIVWGAVGNDNAIALLAIFVGVALVMRGDPLVGRVIDQLAPRRT